jgi:hypothetical protein
MQLIEYRYLHDAQVRTLVDSLEHHIHALQFTPSEIRECAMLAAIHYERRRSSQSISLARKDNMQNVDPYHYRESCLCEACTKVRQNALESLSTDVQHNNNARDAIAAWENHCDCSHD